jgi:hypothetical protein
MMILSDCVLLTSTSFLPPLCRVLACFLQDPLAFFLLRLCLYSASASVRVVLHDLPAYPLPSAATHPLTHSISTSALPQNFGLRIIIVPSDTYVTTAAFDNGMIVVAALIC